MSSSEKLLGNLSTVMAKNTELSAELMEVKRQLRTAEAELESKTLLMGHQEEQLEKYKALHMPRVSE